MSGRAALPGPPGLADRAGARLADVEPSGGVDPEDVEFEDRVIRHGLDHPAHAAAGDHRERRRPQARVTPGFSRAGPDGQLVVLGAGQGVDRAPGLAPQVVALGRGAGDGRQEPAAGQDRAERAQPGAAVGPGCGQERDREARRTRRRGLAAAQSGDAAVCAISAIAAALVIARVSAAAVRRGPKATAAASLLTSGLKVLLAVEIALGIALGLADVAIPAAATRWGQTSYSGFLLGAFALGSVAGGIWFGQRDWKSPPQQRYLVATLLLALALAPPIAATGAATLAPLLIISGLAYGPATISLFEALDTLAPSRATEALTWVTTAGATGTAAGSAASGWAIERFGLWAPFAAASLTLAATAALGLWSYQQGQPASL